MISVTIWPLPSLEVRLFQSPDSFQPGGTWMLFEPWSEVKSQLPGDSFERVPSRSPETVAGSAFNGAAVSSETHATSEEMNRMTWAEGGVVASLNMAENHTERRGCRRCSGWTRRAALG